MRTGATGAAAGGADVGGVGGGRSVRRLDGGRGRALERGADSLGRVQRILSTGNANPVALVIVVIVPDTCKQGRGEREVDYHKPQRSFGIFQNIPIARPLVPGAIANNTSR